MITYHDMPQGSDEWLEARLGIITASRFGDVMSNGLARRGYMLDLCVERMTGMQAPRFVNDFMTWGTECEPQARAMYELVTGKNVVETGFVTNDKFAGVGISPDGLVGEDGLIEIKCPKTSTHIDYLIAKKLPAKYKAQVQGQLWITEREWCDFVSFDPRINGSKQIFIHRVMKDDPYIEKLAEAVHQFKDELHQLLKSVEAA